MTRSIVTLIGLMGAGKSKVGRTAAARLHRPFVDTDTLIAEAAGMPVSLIFEREGEPAFRRRERTALAAAFDLDGAIVSVGGGAVLDAANVERMRAAGHVVWLYAEPATLAARLRNSVLRGDRPLLADGDPLDVLRRLLAERGPVYAAAASATLDTDGMAVDESAALLADWIRDHA